MGSIHIESRSELAAVGWAQGRSHARYEDRYRMLVHPIPLVAHMQRGQIMAVCDGVGSAPMGVQAAQHVCDALLQWYQSVPPLPCQPSAMSQLLQTANQHIHGWGRMPDSDRPLGACAATVAWLIDERLHLFHAGDTLAMLCSDDHGHRVLSRLDQAPGGELLNYFGMDTLTLHHTDIRTEAQDRLLLASDGVSKVMGHAELRAVVSTSASPAQAVRTILEKCSHSTGDDITALVWEME